MLEVFRGSNLGQVKGTQRLSHGQVNVLDGQVRTKFEVLRVKFKKLEGLSLGA